MSDDEEREAVIAGTYVDPAMEGVTLRIEDCARSGRLLYGDEHYARIAGMFRPVPEHDWRFVAVYADGGSVTFGVGTTAEQVAASFACRAAERGVE